MIIREATLTDLPALLEFEQGVIRAERPFDMDLGPDVIHYYDLSALIQSEDSVVMVVEDQNRLIASGYADIRRQKAFYDHDRYAYLGFMYVVPDQRGSGIILQLLETLKKWCLAMDVHHLWLEVYEQNLPAVKAYQKAGFHKSLVQMRLNLEQ